MPKMGSNQIGDDRRVDELKDKEEIEKKTLKKN